MQTQLPSISVGTENASYRDELDVVTIEALLSRKQANKNSAFCHTLPVKLFWLIAYFPEVFIHTGSFS